MSDSLPPETCVVAGCSEPAVVTPRSPTAEEVVDSQPGEIEPLCAVHAEQANTPPNPPKE